MRNRNRAALLLLWAMANVRGIGWGVALVVAIGGGCGGNGGSGDTPLSSLSGQVLDALCPAAVRCGEYPDVGTCRSSMSTDVGQIQADVNAGKVKYDGKQAAACIDALSGVLASCDVTGPLDQPMACTKTFTGTVAAGGDCYIPQECVSGECEFTNCDKACCTGTCTAQGPGSVPLGQPCDGPGACVPGAFCDTGAASPTCAQTKGAGESCSDSYACPSGMLCLPTSTSATAPLACIQAPKEGDACTGPGTCGAENDFCDPTALKCKARLAPGSVCDASNGDDPCVLWAFCDATGACVARAHVGEACDDTNGPPCLMSLACNAGKCVLQGGPVCP
jgi:hypothetical protein